MVYNLINLRRQWRNYLDHVKIYNLPYLQNATSPLSDQIGSGRRQASTANSPASHTERQIDTNSPPYSDLRAAPNLARYSEIMNKVRMENVEADVVLYAILEQVNLN